MCQVEHQTTCAMGYLKTSVLVLLLAVAVSRIPGWFKTEPKIPAVVGFVEPGWEHVRDVYRFVPYI